MRDTSWVRCPNCSADVQAPGEDQITTPLFVATCTHCGLEFDWRLSDKDYLRGAALHWEEYLTPSATWDHDHCAMCWQKFMEAELAGVEQAGYVVYRGEQEWWICLQCFEDLHEEMNWQVESPQEPPAEPGAAADRPRE